MITQPDKWLLVEIKGKDPHYRIFGSWYGGYLGSDSWRLNSGIERYEEFDKYYEFYGYSGSIYKCMKGEYGFNNYSGSVLMNMVNKYPDRIFPIYEEDLMVEKLKNVNN